MRQKYRKSTHGVYDLKVHLAWITKYRYPVLQKKIAFRLREIVRQIRSENNVVIISGNIAPDHVHILVSYPPNISVRNIVARFARELCSPETYGFWRSAFGRPGFLFGETPSFPDPLSVVSELLKFRYNKLVQYLKGITSRKL